ILELDALDHAAVVHVEAGDDAFGEGHDRSLWLFVFELEVAERLGFRHVQRALIDRTTGDGADDAGGVGVEQLLDIADVVNTAGRDYRNLAGVGQSYRRLDVAACIMPSLAMSV